MREPAVQLASQVVDPLGVRGQRLLAPRVADASAAWRSASAGSRSRRRGRRRARAGRVLLEGGAAGRPRPGTNITTNSGCGLELLPVATCSRARRRACAGAGRAPCSRPSGSRRPWPPSPRGSREGHLGVDDDVLAAGETHHEVGPLHAVVAGHAGLLVEVAVLDHAPRTRPPGAAASRPSGRATSGAAQRGDQLGRLGAQLAARSRHGTHLLAQLGVGPTRRLSTSRRAALATCSRESAAA